MLSLCVGGCSSNLAFQRSPAGTVGARLESAGANYQATEAIPQSQTNPPNEATPRYR